LKNSEEYRAGQLIAGVEKRAKVYPCSWGKDSEENPRKCSREGNENPASKDQALPNHLQAVAGEKIGKNDGGAKSTQADTEGENFRGLQPKKKKKNKEI